MPNVQGLCHGRLAQSQAIGTKYAQMAQVWHENIGFKAFIISMLCEFVPKMPVVPLVNLKIFTSIKLFEELRAAF